MSALPEPFLRLSKRLDAIEEQLRRLNNANPLTDSGITLTAPGAFEIDGDVTVTGNFTADGKISNDALTNPTSPQAVYDSVQNFAVPTTFANVKTVTVPVPAGFTSASVVLTVRCYAINSTAGLDYLFSQANINGFNGWALAQPASGSGGSCLNTSTFAGVLSGATLGSNLVLQAAVGSSFGTWAANAQNTADVAASITWYR